MIRNALAVVLVATPMFLQTDSNAQGAGIYCTSKQCRTLLTSCHIGHKAAQDSCHELADIPAQGAYDICVNIRSDDRDGLTEEDKKQCEKERDQTWENSVNNCMEEPDKELDDCLDAYERICTGGEEDPGYI